MKRVGEEITFEGCDLIISTVPIRRVIKRGSLVNDGRFYSQKMRTTIPHESPNELAFLIRAELDPTVSKIYAQPLQFEWDDGARRRRHTPDFAIIRAGFVEIHEVKPDSKANDPDVQANAKFGTHYCEQQGASYSLTLSSILKSEPQFGNLGAVARHITSWVPASLVQTVVHFVRSNGASRICDIIAIFSDIGCSEQAILTMLAHNHLWVDYRSRVTDQANVWVGITLCHSGTLLPKAAPLGQIK